MRLTKDDRYRIERSIVADVPRINYEEQIQNRVNAICAAEMPPLVRRVWDQADLRGFLQVGRFYFDCVHSATPGFNRDEAVNDKIKNDPEVVELHRLHDAQRDAREEVVCNVRSALCSCTTDVQFRERYPELAKYAPAPEAVVNLPATTDLVDCLKAVGVQLESAAA